MSGRWDMTPDQYDAPVVALASLPQWAEERKARGLCALIAGRCVTHDVPDSMEHHFAVTPIDDGRISGFANND